MTGLLQDVRYALRQLRKTPGITAVAVITLALGIGVNSAIFSIANTLLFRRLPFRDPDRLAAIVSEQTQTKDTVQASWADLQDLRAHTGAFDGVAAYRCSANSWVSPQSGSSAQRVTVVETGQGFFPLLGVRPMFGRSFSQSDYQPRRYGDGQAIIVPVVLSHRLWQSYFAGRPDVIGQMFTINGNRAQVVGVMAPGFQVLRNGQAEVFYPAAEVDAGNWEYRWRVWDVVARLRPGVEMSQAEAAMQVFATRRGNEDRANNAGIAVHVRGLHDHLFGHSWKPFPLLFGTASLLLLIACASVANLLLSQAAGREREMALRSALGATRPRIIRQLTIESGLVAGSGGAAGLFLAWLCLRVFNAFAARADMSLAPAQIDAFVLGFAVVLSFVTGIAFGWAPALHLLGAGQSAAVVLKGSSGIFSGHVSEHRLSGMLITAEVALSIALLVGMGLALKTLWRLNRVPPGFETERVLLMEIGKAPFVNTEASFQSKAVFWPQFLERVQTLPGVQAAAFSDDFPTLTQDEEERPTARIQIGLEGRQLPAPGYLIAEGHEVTSDYFRAAGIPLLRGRFFGRDLPTTRLYSVLPEALISERFAREQWPNEDPIGRIIVAPHNIRLTIVGIVGDVKQHGLRQDVPHRLLYAPIRYWDFSNYQSQYLLVRTTDSVALSVNKVTAALHALNPERSVLRARSIDEIVRNNTAWDRLRAVVVAALGTLALLLTAIGVYGTVARAVAARTREIGIRIAIGSQLGACVRLVVRRGLRASLAGLAFGVVLAWIVARVLRSQFFGVSPTDPAIYLGVLFSVALTAFLACYIPARRAAKVDPVVALRYE